MVNPVYKVNLKATHAECEANFWRLLKLLPKEQDQQSYWVNLATEQIAEFVIAIEQRATYTTMLKLTWHSSVPWQEQQVFTVRMYHDAAMAEVTSYQAQRATQGRYYYPNQAMFHPDEKHQHNTYLSEILNNVLKHGAITDTVATCYENVIP